MGELRIEEMSLPALFDQARKIHLSASESGIDQSIIYFVGCCVNRNAARSHSEV